MFASQTEGELKVTQILKESFPRATTIKVTDISGKGSSSSHEVVLWRGSGGEGRWQQGQRGGGCSFICVASGQMRKRGNGNSEGSSGSESLSFPPGLWPGL